MCSNYTVSYKYFSLLHISSFCSPNLLNLLTMQEVLDSLPLGSISQTKAILGSCTYDSLLMVAAQDNRRRAPTVFLFQCEETGVRTLISLLLMLTVKTNKHCCCFFLMNSLKICVLKSQGWIVHLASLLGITYLSYHCTLSHSAH